MLRKADRHLLRNLGTPYDGALLANSVGVCERTLQRHFLACYGMSPREWSRCLALHAARRALRSRPGGEVSVKQVAYATGFRHLGRFSGHFKSMFGESPAELIHRAAGGARE